MALSIPRPEGLRDEVRLWRVLVYVTGGTRGGRTRLEILRLVRFEPLNAHRIAQRLRLNYKTVRHHLMILEQTRVVARIPKRRYGGLYFLSPELEECFPRLISGLRFIYPELVDWNQYSLALRRE
jgi:DNA-binding transcriptional ArsR family regulator